MLRKLAIFALVLTLGASWAYGDTRVGDLCRIKGQEENTLQGVGLVAGLRGTGDGDSRPTQRALAQMMELMGSRVGQSTAGAAMLDELKNAKNVALVFVTATVPAGGAQPGDQVDCVVSAVGAKSLEGGYLMITALKGPNPKDPFVYATAQGLLSIDDALMPQSGRVVRGGTIEREFKNQFVKDNKITLILKPEYAGFAMTTDIAQAINDQRDIQDRGKSLAAAGPATPKGQDRVEVEIPERYQAEPEKLASALLDAKVAPPNAGNTVIVDKRLKAIIVGADVEIAPVAVMHKNRVIETGGPVSVGQFVPIEVRGPDAERSVKLQSLVNALNALQVPTEDVIDIVILLKQKRALIGQLIVK